MPGNQTYKKGSFLYEMNSKINGSSIIHWTALHQLSKQTKMRNHSISMILYSCTSFLMTCIIRNVAKNLDIVTILTRLNTPQMTTCIPNSKLIILTDAPPLWKWKVFIKKLKNNKSVLEDLISNEMLKGSNKQFKLLLLKLFIDCLHEQGVYPWNSSMITTP